MFKVITQSKKEILKMFQIKNSYYYSAESGKYIIYEKLVSQKDNINMQNLEEVKEEIFQKNQKNLIKHLKIHENIIETLFFKIKNWFGLESALKIKERYELIKEKYENSLSEINKEAFIESIEIKRKLKEELRLFELIEEYRNVYLVKYDNHNDKDFLKIIPYQIKSKRIIFSDLTEENKIVDFNVSYQAKEKNKEKSGLDLETIVFDVRATNEGNPFIHFAPYKQEVFINKSEAIDFLKEMIDKNPQLKKHRKIN